MRLNDVAKFQEGIMIIMEYCVAKQIQLIGISNYFENEVGNEILLKTGIQRLLLEYFAGIPQLKQLSKFLQLQSLSYNPKNRNERRDQLNKDFIYYHLFQDIQYNKLSNRYFHTINEDQMIHQKSVMLQKLNQIAQAKIVFPQILCAIETQAIKQQLRFNLEPNRKFIKMLKQFEKYNNLQQKTQTLSETAIIEQILFNTNTNMNENNLCHYKLQMVQSFFADFHKIDYQQFEPNIIYQRLLDLENLYKQINQKRIQQKFKKLRLIINLQEYHNRDLIFPDIIKSLQIKQFHSQNVVLSLGHKSKCFYDINRYQNTSKIVEDNVINEFTYEELKSKYSHLTTSKQVEQLLVQMLKLIFENREQCQQQLVQLFRVPRVIKFMNRIISLRNYVKEQEPFQILLSLKSYVEQFNDLYPQMKRIMFHSGLEKSYARKNITILLQLLVEKDIVIPELIVLLKFYSYDNKPPKITLSNSFKTYNILENNFTIKTLLSEYIVPYYETYQIFNKSLNKIQLKTTLSEANCIINRLDAIYQHRINLLPDLKLIFQQQSVNNLIQQLELHSNSLNQTDEAYVVYQILKALKTELDRDIINDKEEN